MNRPTHLALLSLLALALLDCRRRPPTPPNDAPPVEARARGTNVTVDGVSIHVEQLGNDRGPLRVVVHGGPGLDHTYLRPWLDPLAQGARLLYVDLRGHGRSGTPADANGYTLAAAAADLAGVITRFGGGAPAEVIAHAFGATVAMELAARRPEHVRKLVLIDPLRDVGQLRAMPERTRAAIGADGWQRITELSTPQGTLRDPRQVTELFRRLGAMWWHRMPSEAVLGRMGQRVLYRAEADEHFLVALAGWDANALASDVRAPTLVISGAEDRTFPADESRTLAERLPHGRFESIAAAGHLPFVEQPEAFRTALDRFLKE